MLITFSFALMTHGDVKVNFAEEEPVRKVQDCRILVNSRECGKIWNWNPKDKSHKPMEKARISLENGILKVDASNCPPDKDGKYGIFVIEFTATKKASAICEYAGKTMKAGAEIKVDKPIAAIITPAYRTEKGMHFQKGGNVALLPQWQTVLKNFSVQNNITGEPTWRLTFETPCIIEIKDVFLVFPEQQPEQSITGNQILNGGAERGWYAVSGSNYSNLNGGVYRDWLGVSWEKDMLVYLDDKEYATGKYSFRLEDGGRQYQNWFRSNPVKFTPGKRSVITFKAKSKDQHGTSLMLFLAVNTAQGYRKFFNIGPEWKTYRFEIPEFGLPVNGVTGNYQGKGDDQFYPTFWVKKTVWLDDLCCWQGAGEIEYQDSTPLVISGEIAGTYALIDSSTTASMNFRNPGGQTLAADISYEINDFFGRTVSSGQLGKITIPAESAISKNYAIPVSIRGPQTIMISADIQGEKQRHGFYFGGIGPEKGLIKRLALDCTGDASAKFLLPFFRDMRIGTARFWSKLSGEKPGMLHSLKGIHEAGIQTFVNVGLDGNAKYHSFSRHDISSWENTIKTNLMPLKDYIDVYEILNEPNIWNGYMKNPDPAIYKEMTPEEYVRITEFARNVITKFSPNAKFAGPTTCGTNINFINSVLKAGGDKLLDIITEHPYRASPEMPDYYAELQDLEKVLFKYGNKPHWATESGWRSEEMFKDNIITDYVRKSVALNIRNILTAFAGGSEVYTIFAMSPWGGASSWQLTQTGGTGRIYEYSPQPVLYAMRAIADIVGNAAPAGNVFLGFEFKCYLFDNGKERIAVLWKWNGEKEKITSGNTFNGTFFDVMGNEIKGDIEIGEHPVYFKTPLPLAKLKKLCPEFVANADIASCHTTISASGINTFDVAISNRGSAILKGDLELTIETQKHKAKIARILPGETVSIPFKTDKIISAKPLTGYIILNLNGKSLSEKVELKSLLVPYMPKDAKINGEMEKWQHITGTTLDFKENGVSCANTQWTSKEKEITAEMKMAWNENGLYLAVIVNKDDFHATDRSIARLWEGDSLQIGFDPMKNAVKNTKGYNGDDFEYFLGEFKKQAAIYRSRASLSLYDSLEKAIGELKNDEVQLVVKHFPGKTVYEAMFVPRAISPFKLIPGSSMRFNLIVNISNGKQRLGWLELTPGIGQYKSPAEFMELLLIK